MKIKGLLKEAKAQFGGEVIDFKDLPKSAQKKVQNIEKIIKLGEADSIEDDLKGKYIYVVFKNAAWGSKKEISLPASMMMKLGKIANAGVADTKIIGQDVAFGVPQK
tara:strand:- start:302 stop:622 length:321 start_codon:yes stop_codon:yes gene_type:complete